MKINLKVICKRFGNVSISSPFLLHVYRSAHLCLRLSRYQLNLQLACSKYSAFFFVFVNLRFAKQLYFTVVCIGDIKNHPILHHSNNILNFKMI